MSRRLCFFSLLLLLLGAPFCAPAGELVLNGAFTQGGLVHGQAPPGSRVLYGERPLKLTPDGRFIFGFHRDAPLSHTLTLVAPDGKVSLTELQIDRREYEVQRIDGISRRLMEPTAKDLVRIRAEAEQAAAARLRDSDGEHFSEPFIWPVKGRISGVYGSQRILNGEPRQPHYGVDIAAPVGTPVLAPAGGVVSLVHPGMFFSGATLMIDHGHGLSSSFLHLERILVGLGEQVVQGQQIATVGASGRVTGPHLDWRISWFDRRLDPQLLLQEGPLN